MLLTRRSMAAKPPIARLVRVLLYIGSKIIKNVLFFIIGVCVCVSVYGIISDRGEARRMEQRERGRNEGEAEWSNERATRNETQPSYFFTIFFFVAAPPPPPDVAILTTLASAAVAHFLYSVSNSSKSRVHNA